MNNNSDPPRISAVITTYNRPNLLKRALLSLASQTLGPDEYEIIVVDDGSEPETQSLAADLGKVISFKYVYQANSGLASAKNHGLCHATAPIVLFLDDDDLSDPDLLEQHLIAHKHYPDPNISILGFTRLPAESAADPLMAFVTGNGGHLFSFDSVPERQLLDYNHFWGGRTSCKRKYLLSHGIFNPVFRFGFEDIELGYRLSRHGLHVVFWKKAANTMIRRLSLARYLRRCYLQGQSGFQFISMYPDDERLIDAIAFTDFDSECEIIKACHGDILASAQSLDSMIRRLPQQGESILDKTHYRTLLHYAYYRAFRAETIRGYSEARSDSLSTLGTVGSAS